jgi:replication-associated recombination protein RarA
MLIKNYVNLESKYRPKSISDLVIPDIKIKTFLLDTVKGYGSNMILLNGTNGTGKSTIARLIPTLIEGYDPHWDILNGGTSFSEEDAISQLKNIVSLARVLGQKYYYVIFDEIDKVNTSLSKLWQLIDTWPNDIMVIATSNDFMKIDKCMRSRFKVLNFPTIKARDFLPRAMEIFGKEKINLSAEYVLGELMKVENLSDIRKYMGTVSDIYRHHINGRIEEQYYSKATIKLPISRHLTLA